MQQWLFCFCADESLSEETPHIEATTQQTLHYTLANQQVQFHRISEDGQVQVVCVILIHRDTFQNNL